MTEGQIPLLPEEPPAARRHDRACARALLLPRSLPVARVALLTPVPHLDRVFDYEVPEKLAAAAQPGCACGCGSPAGWSTASSWSGWRPPSVRCSL